MHALTRHVLGLLAASAMSPAFAQRPCEWRDAAWPEDRAAIETAIGQARDFAKAFTPENADIATARGLLARATSPHALGDIGGQWRVRSIQVHSDFAYAYPYFNARIHRDGCGWAFAKTTGSQRRSGVLRPIKGDQRALAFLGGAYVNDDPVLAYSRIADRSARSGNESDTVGRLVRIGPRELLLILDVDPRRSGFELYQLKR